VQGRRWNFGGGGPILRGLGTEVSRRVQGRAPGRYLGGEAPEAEETLQITIQYNLLKAATNVHAEIDL